MARVRLHGNPGTAAGRRLGGLHSIAVQQKKPKPSGFVVLRSIPLPRESAPLAELLGILAGDGHIGVYQTSVSTNSETDLEHAYYVKALFERLFPIRASLSFRSNCNACVVVVNSKNVGEILVKKGMVRGHKIKGGLCMPKWVFSRKKHRLAFTRGAFDTDGCVYVDCHTIRGRLYKNIGIAFTNRSLPLLLDFKNTLESIGLHPTQKTKYTVFLRREAEIRIYFKVIGSSNPKHTRKVEQYFLSKQRRSARNW
ncbi:MAG: LAGLIDADG family homing endonuclease [Candidatus Staskawiczbacteria bacterium]|nr:LAGLIDADG family homing endonuclease [Candidatus Staskawiczbacteria bacterium]